MAERKRDNMIKCCKCNKELQFCTCEDIEERIRAARNDPDFIFKMCKRCDRHYARCKCVTPVWGTSWDGVNIELFESLKGHMEKVR